MTSTASARPLFTLALSLAVATLVGRSSTAPLELGLETSQGGRKLQASCVSQFAQCGGAGGDCSGTQCVDAATACCPANFGCSRNNQWYWQCIPGAAAISLGVVGGSASPPPPTATVTASSVASSTITAAAATPSPSPPATTTAASGTFSGDATYYDATAPPDASGFDCVQNGKPGSYGNLPTVALNAAQELANNRAACGMCILLAGTGSGAGANPVSTTPTKYVVSNQCPECAYGSIDIATNGNGSGRPGLDGRWQITWSFVSCGSKRKSSLRRAMLGIEDSSSRHDFSSEVDPEELAALTWQTGQARFVAS